VVALFDVAWPGGKLTANVGRNVNPKTPSVLRERNATKTWTRANAPRQRVLQRPQPKQQQKQRKQPQKNLRRARILVKRGRSRQVSPTSRLRRTGPRRDAVLRAPLTQDARDSTTLRIARTNAPADWSKLGKRPGQMAVLKTGSTARARRPQPKQQQQQRKQQQKHLLRPRPSLRAQQV